MCARKALLPPLQNKGMSVVALVCLSVCLFVDNITQKSYEWIEIKFDVVKTEFFPQHQCVAEAYFYHHKQQGR